MVAAAAAVALGKIGTRDAAQALARRTGEGAGRRGREDRRRAGRVRRPLAQGRHGRRGGRHLPRVVPAGRAAHGPRGRAARPAGNRRPANRGENRRIAGQRRRPDPRGRRRTAAAALHRRPPRRGGRDGQAAGGQPGVAVGGHADPRRPLVRAAGIGGGAEPGRDGAFGRRPALGTVGDVAALPVLVELVQPKVRSAMPRAGVWKRSAGRRSTKA